MDAVSTNSHEQAYLDLLKNVSAAPVRKGRNGDTRQITFASLHFSAEKWPLMTCRRMPWKSIVYELAWFLRGDTDTKFLDDNGVFFWRKNTSKEFLASRGIDAPDGTVGKSYGYQWVRQLPKIIEEIKTAPESRRLLVVAWQVDDLSSMALPPCHYSYQFVVRDGHLDLVATMRSADLALGVPCNVASYGLLLHLVAAATALHPGELYLNMTNCHLYCDHLAAVETISARTPREFPRIHFTDDYLSELKSEGFAAMQKLLPEKIILEDYHPHPRVHMEMIA